MNTKTKKQTGTIQKKQVIKGKPFIAPKKKKKTKLEKKIKNNKIQSTPTFQADPAPQVLSTIDITATMCPFARETWSLAIISRLASLYTSGLGYIYYIYQAMDADFVAVTKSQTPVLFSRIAYVNSLFELIKAKTVNTPNLNISYQFDGTTLAGPPQPAITIRGQVYYMWNPGVDNGNSLTLMIQPVAIPFESTIDRYNDALPIMVGNSPKKMLRQEQVSEASKVFTNDASAYAQRAMYVSSQGSCPSGGYSSSELEVYGKVMSTLSTFVELPITVYRTAHYLQFSSLDTTGSFGIPYLENFKMLDFSTKLAPIVKYIDLSQLWAVWVGWLGETIRKGYDIEQNQGLILDFLNNPIPLVYAIIAFRQSVLKYFQTSQAAVQFQSYSYALGEEFEGLRMGTNAVSRINVPLSFPTMLVENCRALAAKRYCRDGPKAEKQCRWYIPCIGLYQSQFWLNPTIPVGQTVLSLFDPAIPVEAIGINYVDGSASAGPMDLNSNVISQVIFAINQQVALNSQVCGPTGFLEGTNDFNLLAFTRYDEFSDVNFKEEYFENRPSWIKKNEIIDGIYTEFKTKKKAYEKTRTKSSKDFNFQLDEGVINLVPRAYSSSVVLTNELLSVLETLVLPSIIPYRININLLVNQQGFQSAFSEPQNFSINDTIGNSPAPLSSLAALFSNVGKSLAPGTATTPTPEVARIIGILQQKGEGGFLDAALSGVMSFVQNL